MVAVSRSLRVSVSVGSASAFRLTVDFGGAESAGGSSTALPSPSLDADRAMANFTRVSGPDGVGIRTGFGELVVSSDGRFTLKDAAGNTVAAASAVPSLAEEGSGHAGITMPVSGSKNGPGATGRRPCLVNGGWVRDRSARISPLWPRAGCAGARRVPRWAALAPPEHAETWAISC